MHAAADASQFLASIRRAWRTKEKVKAQFIGDGDREGWDLPLKLKRMRWATYEKWEAKFDAAEDAPDNHPVMATARLMNEASRLPSCACPMPTTPLKQTCLEGQVAMSSHTRR